MKGSTSLILPTLLLITVMLWSIDVYAAARHTDATTGMQFVGVPAGCSPIGGSDREGKQGVETCFTKFFIGVYPVTQGEWKRIMGNNPSSFSSCGDDCPVDSVSWLEAQEFINRLNDQSKGGYRLPTEAEWEYVCRSGKRNEKFCGGNNLGEVAWNISNSGKKTHPVGLKKPNDWGVYDMTGNVWQWVQDWYDDKYPGGAQDPKGPDNGIYRVFRGGGYRSDSVSASLEMRFRDYPTHKNKSNGFRLVFTAME